VAEYLLRLSMSFDRTPYAGIKKLPPGRCPTVTAERTGLGHYFELSAEPALKLKGSREDTPPGRRRWRRGSRARNSREARGFGADALSTNSFSSGD